MKNRETFTLDRFLYSRKEAARLLSYSLSTIDTLLARGILRARKLGRRMLIPRAELERLSKINLPSLWPKKVNGKTVRRGGP